VTALVLVVGLMSVVGMVSAANRQTASTLAQEGGNNLAREVMERAREIPYASLSSSNVTTSLQALPGLATAGGPGWTIPRRGVTYTVTATACTIDDPGDGVGSRNPATFCVLTSTGSGGSGGGGGGGLVGGSGIWADLGILDTSLNATLSGALVDVVCTLAGPLNINLGVVTSLARAGAGVVLCPLTGQQVPGDANADDMKRVTVDVTWNGGTRSVRQVTLIPNPLGAAATS
jgi:hypothetical protein